MPRGVCSAYVPPDSVGGFKTLSTLSYLDLSLAYVTAVVGDEGQTNKMHL